MPPMHCYSFKPYTKYGLFRFNCSHMYMYFIFSQAHCSSFIIANSLKLRSKTINLAGLSFHIEIHIQYTKPDVLDLSKTRAN